VESQVGPDPGSRIKAAGLRMGAARRQVIDVLGSMSGPVTAEEVAVRLPDVHVSSVYRSLNVLEELGVVRHVHLTHGPALFELSDVAAQIRHLACERCGRDVVVPASLFDDLRTVIEQEYGFVIDGGHFAIPGRCTDCIDCAG
jgi:Fur family transcriptional regulator, ferric uptake regulator